MKKFLRKIIGVSVISIPRLVKGQEVGGTGSGLIDPLKGKNFIEIVEAVAKILGEIGIVVAAIFIIYSGFLFVTARGNETQLEKAKKTFFWTVVGTLILYGSWIIAKALQNTIKTIGG